jgi:hypothetical protein
METTGGGPPGYGRGTQYLEYPATIGDELMHWLSFEGYSFKNKTAMTLNVALYIPGDSLTTSYKSEYEAASLGAVFGKGAEMFQKVGGDSDFVDSAVRSQQNAAGGEDKAQVIGSVVSGALGQGSAGAKIAMQQKTGAVVNPYMVAAYKGPTQLREHSFSFKMMPDSASEGNAVNSIVKAFKKAMLPGHKGGDSQTAASMYFQYPDEFEIKYMVQGSEATNSMFKIGRSVLTNCELNYATQDVPLFFADSQHPVTTEMKLTFMEIEVMSRDKIDKGF